MKYKGSFTDEKAYLSNMYSVGIVYNKKVYTSSESIYMLFKNNSKEWQDFILNNSPYKVKSKSRKIELVSNWGEIKVKSMKLALILKFSQHPGLLLKLKEEKELIEYNNWNDKFWGKDIETKEGLNMLGKLLEEVRDTLS